MVRPRARARRASMSRLAMVVTAIAVVLAGCRVDVTIDVAMRDDGSGDLRVTLAADGDVVREAGGLEEDLRFDDLLAAGWEVGAPASTEGGGLQVVLAHPFASPGELSALLASLNGADGPFKSVVFERIPGTSDVSFSVTGTGRVDAGLASFADAELIAAVGATPYADDVARTGLSQSDAVVITLNLDLPGEIEQTTGTHTGDVVTWVIPLDSRPVDLTTRSTLSLQRTGWKIAADVLQATFVGWLVLAGVVLLYVPFARRRRALDDERFGDDRGVERGPRRGVRPPGRRAAGGGAGGGAAAGPGLDDTSEWADPWGGWPDDGALDDADPGWDDPGGEGGYGPTPGWEDREARERRRRAEGWTYPERDPAGTDSPPDDAGGRGDGRAPRRPTFPRPEW